MSKKILISYNFNGNEVQNAKMHVVAGSPTIYGDGQFWYDSSALGVRWRANGATIDPLARANHTGTQLASTISNFDTQVRTNRIDQLAAAGADVSFGAFKITNLAPGVSGTDAVNFNQLSQVMNGKTWKDAVRVASTANVAAISGLLTIDGVVLVAGDRVLLKDQSTGAQNGIWVVAAGAWARAADMDDTTPDTELKDGCTVKVAEGTANAGKEFTMTTNGPITVGTTATAWVNTGTGVTYINGTGINITGGNTIGIDTAVVVQKYATNIGDAAATSITVTHGLGTKDITYSVRQNSDDTMVDCDVTATSTTQATFIFASAPALNALRVVIHA